MEKRTLLLAITTFGSAGLLSKRMPGTVGSVVATVISYVIPNSTFFTLAVILFIIGSWTCQFYVLRYAPYDKDPRYIVIDEVCAVFLNNAITVQIFSYKWYMYLLTFLFFRLFDIWKPYPINKIEKYCKMQNSLIGIGIMLDDILASIPTVICSCIVIWLLS